MNNVDSKRPEGFITYLDANNLYGWTMFEKLSVGNFKWMANKDLKNWYNNFCYMEVNLEYPENLYDLHRYSQLFLK